MYKKLLVLLLCGAMLVAMLASCVNADQGEDSSAGANEEESNWVSPDLEFSDAYKGKELVILSNKDTDIGPEENSSDPLEDAVLTCGMPLGVSNEFIGTQASVSVKESL